MAYSRILAQLRNKRNLTQEAVAEHLSKFFNKTYTAKNISQWENGKSEPSNEQFLLLCELYGVDDIQTTFRSKKIEYRGFNKLNALGKSRVEEYIAMLTGNSLFSEFEDKNEIKPRYIKLYDAPVGAGYGSFLDGDGYEEIEIDATVPKDADYAVKVSGDSMIPRFVDGQIIFIKEQSMLEIGEIGIFEVDGDAYVKKLGQGKLISLNESYKPIQIREFNSFRIFGKVIG